LQRCQEQVVVHIIVALSVHAGDQIWEKVARRGTTETGYVSDAAIVILRLVDAVLDALGEGGDELCAGQREGEEGES